MDFVAFLRSLGIIPKAVLDDGRWRRGGTDSHPKSTNGAWKLLPGGRLGFGQNWAAHDAPIMWRAGKDAVLPALDLDAMRRAQREHEAAQARAVQACRRFYESCQPLRGGHPYLDSHGLDMTGCFGLRLDADGWLVVPAYRGDDVQSVQRIAPDGEKRFWPGAPVSGTRYMIKRRNATVTLLCEGLATGLACAAALASAAYDAQCVVLWNTGNAQRTAPLLSLSGFVVFCADNDWGTEKKIGKNPGLLAAKSVADAVGCGVAVPVCEEGTDFSDMRQEMVAKRLPNLQRHQTKSSATRAVDALIARQIMREAVFLSRRPEGL